ncbi:MAG: hypothetical protein JXR37_29285 [Kiritimatiellae bacterium]|nr:hypothetical protein [Kiritimatiellia bacterium]
MNTSNAATPESGKVLKRAPLFPAFVLALYAIGYAVNPEKTTVALKTSANVLLSVAVPLALVFAVMLLLNRFVRPARIAGVLGRKAGLRAMLFAIGAGILSAGPIFAWYPLMRKLRQAGAGEETIAVFLCNRAVKPFLLPVMISYYGWIYVAILTLLTILGSLILGYVMRVAFRSR